MTILSPVQVTDDVTTQKRFSSAEKKKSESCDGCWESVRKQTKKKSSDSALWQERREMAHSYAWSLGVDTSVGVF